MKDKELTDTQKNWIKRFNRKVSEGVIRPVISWLDFMKDKKEITKKDFDELEDAIGRIGNKTYKVTRTGKYELYIKFKNTTKAKKYMERIRNGK